MDPSKSGWWFGNNDDNYMTGTNTYPLQGLACNPPIPYGSNFTVDAPSNFCSQGLGGMSLVDQPVTFHIKEGASSTAHPLPIFHQPQPSYSHTPNAWPSYSHTPVAWPSYSHTPDAWPWTNSDPIQMAKQDAPYEVGSSNWNSGFDSHVTPWVTNPFHTEGKSPSDPEDELVDEICERVAIEQELEFISLLEVAMAYIQQRTPYHTRPGTGFKWVCDILRSDHPKKSIDNFAMTKETYLVLCQELVEKYGFSISSEGSISILESLGMFLCLLRGMNLQQIDSFFNRDNEIVSEQIDIVLECLLRMASDQVAPHREQNECHPYLESRPMYRHFKNCIGVIDGMHLPCKPKPSEEYKYRGRKGGRMMNVMVMCDFDLCFIFASSGWEGSMHEYDVFKQVLSGRHRDRFPHPEEGKYYLVDMGYPNQKGYMAPYKGYKYHKEGNFRRANKPPKDDKQWFNRAHSSLWSCVERSIGLLKDRWSVLKNEPSIGGKKYNKIVIASMAIHNYIIRNCPDDSILAEVVQADDTYTYKDAPDISTRWVDAEDKGGRPQEAENDMEMEELRDSTMSKLKKDRKTGLF